MSSRGPDGSGHGGSPSMGVDDYWWYRVRAQLLETVLTPYVGDAESVLDVGSADGPSVGWLRGRRTHVTLDIDPRGLRPGEGVNGSALALPFADESFDVVGAFDVVEHCEPEAVVLAEFARVLQPGGRLLMSVPAYQWAWTDFDEENGHRRRYTRDRAVLAVQGQGFEVLRVSYAFAGTFPFFAAERLLRRAVRTVRPAPVAPADVVSLPQTPAVVDRLLTGLSGIDRRLLRSRDLPFGSSVVLCARKPA